jgi:hypothetical protein
MIQLVPEIAAGAGDGPPSQLWRSGGILEVWDRGRDKRRWGSSCKVRGRDSGSRTGRVLSHWTVLDGDLEMVPVSECS